MLSCICQSDYYNNDFCIIGNWAIQSWIHNWEVGSRSIYRGSGKLFWTVLTLLVLFIQMLYLNSVIGFMCLLTKFPRFQHAADETYNFERFITINHLKPAAFASVRHNRCLII